MFSNAAGSYSANVGIAIENGASVDEEQLQEPRLHSVRAAIRGSLTLIFITVFILFPRLRAVFVCLFSISGAVRDPKGFRALLGCPWRVAGSIPALQECLE